MNLDPITSMRLLSKKWRAKARSLIESADAAAEEFRDAIAPDWCEPASVRAIRDSAATYEACALEVEAVVAKEETADIVRAEWAR